MAYTINDFKKGDQVYHLSNLDLNMVVIEVNPDLNEVSCRWVDKNGITQCSNFFAEELAKSSASNFPLFYG